MESEQQTNGKEVKTKKRWIFTFKNWKEGRGVVFFWGGGEMLTQL